MERWNPWRALRAIEAELWFADLHGDRGRWVRTGRGDEIYLDHALDRRERREVLAHELIHVERGIGRPDATPDTMQREEVIVWREALDRLVPPDELVAFLVRRVSEGPVTLDELAEEFDLSLDGARRIASRWEQRDRHRTDVGLAPPGDDAEGDDA